MNMILWQDMCSAMFPIVHLLPQACMRSNASFLSVCLSVSRKILKQDT